MQNLWKGQKVSEKVFGRVLISSICGIFLCLACLVSATWAWYIVGIENPGNTITIADVKAHVTVDDGSIIAGEDGAYTLPVGTHTLQVKPDNQTAAAYVVMSVNGNETCYFAFESGQNSPATMQIVAHESAVISVSTQWTLPQVAPVGTELTIGEAPTVTEDQTGNDTQAPTEDDTMDTDDMTESSGAPENTEDPENGKVPETGDEP